MNQSVAYHTGSPACRATRCPSLGSFDAELAAETFKPCDNVVKPWNKVCSLCLKMAGSNRKKSCCGENSFKRPSDPWLIGKKIVYPKNAKAPTTKCKNCRKPLACNNALSCKACGTVRRPSNKGKKIKRKRIESENVQCVKRKKVTPVSPPVLVRGSSLVPLGFDEEKNAGKALGGDLDAFLANIVANGDNVEDSGDNVADPLGLFDFNLDEPSIVQSDVDNTSPSVPAISRQSSLEMMWQEAPIDYVSTSGFDYGCEFSDERVSV